MIKEPQFRCPTKEAIEKLVERFNFEYSIDMQDWEWQVADYSRIDEFIDYYEKDGLTNDEKFTLMETMIQSFEDSETELESNEKWKKIIKLLNKNFNLHQYSIWYWASFDYELIDCWNVSQFMRRLYKNNI